MDIREYLKAKEGHTWRPEDTVWIEDKLRPSAEYLDARWRENAAWNARALAEREAQARAEREAAENSVDKP